MLSYNWGVVHNYSNYSNERASGVMVSHSNYITKVKLGNFEPKMCKNIVLQDEKLQTSSYLIFLAIIFKEKILES